MWFRSGFLTIILASQVVELCPTELWNTGIVILTLGAVVNIVWLKGGLSHGRN